jgi:hypothetical protein
VVVAAATERLLMGIYFYPRGGSAHSARAICRELGANGFEVTLLSGSRSDLGEDSRADRFYKGLDLRALDFTPAVGSADPLRYRGPAGTAPIHGSYEDRPGAPDRVLASLDEEAFELQVEVWAEAMTAAAENGVDALYLHHLTPLNEAAARALPGVPVIGHVHGTELLMLEAIEAGASAGWTHAGEWAGRLRRWAAACKRIVVNDIGGLERAAALLEPSRPQRSTGGRTGAGSWSPSRAAGGRARAPAASPTRRRTWRRWRGWCWWRSVASPR